MPSSYLPSAPKSSGGFSGLMPTSLPGGAERDICAACGGLLQQSSLNALDRMWHPECFINTVTCTSCARPFSLTNLQYKVKDGQAYHSLCYEGTTGLLKQELKKFFGSKREIIFSVELPRKTLKAGEAFKFKFKINNPTQKEVCKVVTYLLHTETRMEIVGSAYERRANRTTHKMGRSEHGDTRLPLAEGDMDGEFVFLVPIQLLPSEVGGIDASFVREYELVTKAVLSKPFGHVKITYQVNLTR